MREEDLEEEEEIEFDEDEDFPEIKGDRGSLNANVTDGDNEAESKPDHSEL